MRRTIWKFLGAIVAGLVLSLPLSTAHGGLLTTFTNPTPAYDDRFGDSVAGVGTDRVLIGKQRDDIGAHDAGSAYLFSTDGTLVTTFTNPVPTAGDRFGNPVASVGADRVLIGASWKDTGAGAAGAAYLYGTNGTLLRTFTNPTPASADRFGAAVAGVGSDRVLIGAGGDDTGAENAGAAYLFSINGGLLTTFTNPTPAYDDRFGDSVAGVGTDRVLIGAYLDNTGATDAGAAYLFHTDGVLLATFTNPTPAAFDSFGVSLAALGTGSVLVGAYYDDASAMDAGAAHLFDTNGALLITFTNPAARPNQFFGRSVAGVGIDRLLIGVEGDGTGAPFAGAAYLFSTNGALLAAFTNPTPADYDLFGFSVAAVGPDRVVIGAPLDSTGSSGAGAAYLLSLEPFAPESPLLSISLDTPLSSIKLSWPAPAEGWVLECTNTLPSESMAPWPQIPLPYQTNGETISVTFTNPPAVENQFFRLHKP